MFGGGSNKTFYLDRTNYHCVGARVSEESGSLTVEELKSFPVDDKSALEESLDKFAGLKKSGYLQAHCGVYPPRRFVRRGTVEPRRLREESYLEGILQEQYQIDAGTSAVALLNAKDGGEYDLSNPVEREVVFCGGSSEDFLQEQDSLLELGVYPESLELGTVAMIGGLLHYLRTADSSAPTLLLEMGMDQTTAFVLNRETVDLARPIPQGLNSMVPIVQEELGLKDPESAKRLFFSDNFDFTGMGNKLARKLLKELHSSTGFYEVQTGQTIEQLHCTLLPPNMNWLKATLAKALALDILKIDYAAWLESLRIRLPDDAMAAEFDDRWVGLIGLMGRYQNSSKNDGRE